MTKTFLFVSGVILSAFVTSTNALAAPQPTRREMIRAGWGAAAASASFAFINANPSPALAEDGAILTDEEMAARVARKQELLRRAKNGGGSTPVSATDIRSDVNPEAGVNLRNRSFAENTKAAMDKQAELKNRDKAQKREDLCEMLGRGC